MIGGVTSLVGAGLTSGAFGGGSSSAIKDFNAMADKYLGQN
jgi:hypothetical protein